MTEKFLRLLVGILMLTCLKPGQVQASNVMLKLQGQFPNVLLVTGESFPVFIQNVKTLSCGYWGLAWRFYK